MPARNDTDPDAGKAMLAPVAGLRPLRPGGRAPKRLEPHKLHRLAPRQRAGDRSKARLSPRRARRRQASPVYAAIFGAEEVKAEWYADGGMRSQIRRWIPKARAMADGGWRDLVPRYVANE